MKILAYVVLFACLGVVGYNIPSIIPFPWCFLVAAIVGVVGAHYGTKAIEEVL